MTDQVINIVVPMAGRGSRFADAGYSLPKPLIDVAGKPMIQRVVENLRPNSPHRFVFITLAEHEATFSLEDRLTEWAPGCEVIPIEGVTRGAAETVLYASEVVDEGPMVIANSDQWVDADLTAFYASLLHFNGSILTMKSQDPKWSYIKRNNGVITEVVEKVVVSDEATVGIYGYSEASLFFSAARQMIAEGNLSNGEYYVAPTYTYLANAGDSLTAISIGAESEGMWGLGTPDDLETFLSVGPTEKLSS
jgi:NDP-sugar pyrophosphorylase family protein